MYSLNIEGKSRVENLLNDPEQLKRMKNEEVSFIFEQMMSNGIPRDKKIQIIQEIEKTLKSRVGK